LTGCRPVWPDGRENRSLPACRWHIRTRCCDAERRYDAPETAGLSRNEGLDLEAQRLVLITGGSSGIGYRLAHDFLGHGDRVVIVADKAEKLADAAERLSNVASSVYAIQCDVADTQSVQAMQSEVLDRFGTPDILVNNAGFATFRTFEATAIEELERLVNVNFVGCLRVTHAFLPSMIARRSGTIVNISSIAGSIALTPHGTYSASKFAVNAWSETLRAELSRFGLRVLVVCPGRVDTPFFDHETFRSRGRKGVETRVNLTTADVSRAVFGAIASGRRVTYVPRYLGPMQWAINTVPFVTRPIIGWFTRRRIEDLYRAAPATPAEVRTP
jgi:short-subunit dehydrogenase